LLCCFVVFCDACMQKRMELMSQNKDTAQAKPLGFLVDARTDPGLTRKSKPNEDSMLAVRGLTNSPTGPQSFGLFIVADGMGGHANGRKASRLAINTMIKHILPILDHGNADGYGQVLVEVIQQANQAICKEKGDMGTTVTAVLLVGSVAYVANVGDSRTY